MEALDQGVNVLIEKPLTETLEQGQQVVARAKENNLILQVGHIERFNRAYTQLKHVIDGKRLIAVNVRRLSSFDASNTDVDVIRDLMIHDLDLIGNLLGHQFESLHAWGRSISTDAIDHAEAIFSYKDGPIVTLVASRITEQKVRSIETIAEGAYIEADLLGKSLMIHRRTFPQFINEAGTYRQESVIERIHVPMQEPLMLELRHFLECVGEGNPSSVPGQDGLYALDLADQITQQIKQRNSLKLSGVPSNGHKTAPSELSQLKV
jgi:predicted dehydrogenase